MIYICQAPAKLCQAGAQLCHSGCKACSGTCGYVNKECGDNVAGLCKFVGDGCGQVFNDCGDGCSGVLKALCGLVEAALHLVIGLLAACISLACSFIRLDQPLGPFMLLSLVVNAPAAYNGLWAMSEPEVLDCREAPLLRFVRVDFAIAIVHILFAAYLKHQVIYGYQPEPNAFEDNQAVLVASIDPERQVMPSSREVGARVRRIALYDPGFCIYFFVFFGSFGYQFYGFDYGHRCDLQSMRTWNMSTLLMMYPFLAMVYTFGFICFTGITAGVETVATGVRNRQASLQARVQNSSLYVGLATTNAPPVQPGMP